MGFIECEAKRVTSRLQAGPLPAAEYERLYAVQQALLWALEPQGFKSPYDLLVPTDIPEGPEGYQAGSGHSLFSDTRDRHAS